MIAAVNLHLDLGEFKLHGVNLEAADGDYMVVLGPSGAGKTLLLECIAGLRKPDSGLILIDGNDVTSLPPEKREIAFLPQNYALWPHMRVFDNIAYPLRCRGISENEIKRMVKRVSDELEIDHILDRKPASLSGGEQQRVALARALVWGFKAILLDEPTAALDPALRWSTWKLLRELHKRLKFTAIHVTHDVAEAFALATKSAFMNEGKIVKQGSLSEVLSTAEAVRYLGDTNIIKGRILEAAKGEALVEATGTHIIAVIDGEPGEEIVLSLRPEDIVILREEKLESSARNILQATVESLEPQGPLVLVHTRSGENLMLKAYITKSSAEHLELKPGSKITLCFKASAVKRIA